MLNWKGFCLKINPKANRHSIQIIIRFIDVWIFLRSSYNFRMIDISFVADAQNKVDISTRWNQ